MLDGREVDALARDLALMPARIVPALVPVAHAAGNKMKAGLRREASGHRRLGGLSAGISYEVETRPTSVSVSAGWYNPVGQGHLENIAAFGSVNNAPIMDIEKPLRAEVPAFTRWVAKVAAEAF